MTLAMWMIYTIDHVIDGFRHKGESKFHRHRIHYEWRRILIPVIFVVFVIEAYIVINYLPFELWVFGTAISLTVVFYFVANRLVLRSTGKNLPAKEIGIALIVTICYTGIPILENGLQVDLKGALVVATFFVLNLSNLWMFSYFDREEDKQLGFGAISAYLETSQLKRLYMYTWTAGLLLCLISFFASPSALYLNLTMLAMFLGLGLISKKENYFIKHDRFRFWGDFIYIYPALYLLLA